MPALPTILPRPEHVTQRLRQIVRRGSANTGQVAEMDRLMLMITRSCDLRCSYCWVGLTEEAYGVDHPATPEAAWQPTDKVGAPLGDVSVDTLRRAIDLLVASPKPQLGLQLFGGEPMRRWNEVQFLLTLHILSLL